MLWFVIGQAGSARADSMVYVVAQDFASSPGPDLFGQVDVKTGSFTLIGDLSTPGYTIFGMGFGTDGQIYGLGFSHTSPFGPGEFYAINPMTGATTDLGPLTFSPAGATGAANGTLYALNFSSSNSSLYSITPPSNSSTLIGTVPFQADGLVAIDSTGNLFASGNGGTLFQINTTNAASTPIGDTGQGTSLYAGTFVGSTLYGFSAGTVNDEIVSIDTTNAHVTPGPNIDLPASYFVVAAAAPPGVASVPEPSSLVLAAIAAMAGLGGLVGARCGRFA